MAMVTFCTYAGEADTDASVSAEIRKVLDQACTAINNRDLKANMAFTHPESPNYKATLMKTQTMLAKYDITTEILEYDSIGTSGGYTFIRVKQKNTFRKGQYKGTVVELVHALKRHEGAWKFWSIMQLAMEVVK
jgi:hypothetical protein